MSLFELLSVVIFGFILAIAVLVGLELDDKAQDIQQSTWHIAK